ncbi:MAG: lysylphosphatidylglycerol synthase transmembrane domain-containing protein [Muribaculaceae bacterium]|nr:lysylphosphatidylglycerol synthase transmembrane domain-containing protein [Muribaculaceae bacterium]
MEKKSLKQILGTTIKYLIPFIIGVGLFYWLYSNLNVEKMKEIMRSDVNYWWIGLALVISVFSHIFRAFRWRLQLRALDIDAPISALINSIFGTYSVNLIFPRLGEVWRSGYIAERQKTSFTTVFGSMVGDRLSDSVTVLALTFFTFFLAQDAFYTFLNTYPQIKDGLWDIMMSPLTWIVVIGAIACVIALFTVKTQNKLVEKIRLMVKNLWDGLYVITKMKGKWWFLFYTFLIWGCYFTQLYVATFAFSYTVDLGLKATLVLFVLSSISMGIPTNGGLGAWHIAIIFGLSLYGIGANFSPSGPFDTQASTFAMVVWGAQTLLLIALGIYAFAYMAVDKHKIKNGKVIVRTKGTGIKL